MAVITIHSLLYLSNEWKNKHKKFIVEEHWTLFIKRLNQCLNTEHPKHGLPYFKEEVTPPIEEIKKYFILAHKQLIENGEKTHSEINLWAKVIENAPFEYLLIILGQRQTSASLKSKEAIPPLKQTLINSCLSPYNNQICSATRAWEKHAGRSQDNFWGQLKGNSEKKNEHVKKMIIELINKKTWWNIFHHYKHQLVYELRISSGHGIRWNKSGTHLIGFLEPFIND
ncbi:MAG: hypothetical protein MK066_06365 [Crocinitomicaceae bacterium]|nr:hypothetical protein [Crocinitomicaceae bacterium]